MSTKCWWLVEEMTLSPFSALLPNRNVNSTASSSPFSGVGGNTARMILSSLSPRELCEIISTGNDKVLKTVKGIGLKTAQRIIIDLKDKIVSLGIADELPASGGNVVMVNNDVKDEAVSALTMLGFSPAPSAKVVVDILKAQPDLPVEQVVKLALKSNQIKLGVFVE